MNRLQLIVTTITLVVGTTAVRSQSNLWGDIEYDGRPWVENVSEPVKVSKGLQNRHISLWASHGRYYDQKKGFWKWQRPNLFGTTEDLYTQTIVVPYLMPMLENAGAIVFSPRERDWQGKEVIVDNDMPISTSYAEVSTREPWQTSSLEGFAFHTGYYRDGENPFSAGTVRMARATKKKKNPSFISYQPNLPESGRYAVYVSYQTLGQSVDDAHYTVWHKGEPTEFYVNQRMGGGTWVYLGTFEFDQGCSEFNRVVLTNQSHHKGIVTADAVRFGGGMGNIVRGSMTSGMPRCVEGARYYAQWAGMPYDIYSTRGGTDDYADDINVRSLMTNYLAGGSCYVPSQQGLGVPLELSLAVHSDAGFSRNGIDLVGSLAICTTDYNDGRLNSGISRFASRDFATALLDGVTDDLRYKYGKWVKRTIYDRNYSETRLPEVPSAILETMSHQNFPDMRMGQDPNFRFTLARSIYKTILRYVCEQHDCDYVVTPLAPSNFHIEFGRKNELHLSWDATDDLQEPTATPTGYIVYTAMGRGDFDNGTAVHSNSYKLKLEPNILYSFKVAATNRGGKSFTTEVLSALYNPDADETILIVNGFHRLSSPAIRSNSMEQGFDLDDDPGITYGTTAGWVGRQINFDRTHMGSESPDGLGWSDNRYGGKFIAGNNFDYVRTHAMAIESAQNYSIVSCSSKAIEAGKVNLSKYVMIDYVLGLEYNDGHSLVTYKTFNKLMQSLMANYTSRGGHLMVSGAFIGRDLKSDTEQQFMADVLKCSFSDTYREASDSIIGLGTDFQFHHALNARHYAATSTEVLQPLEPAFPAMAYTDGRSACVAYKGDDYHVITLGFPFECIKDEQKRASIMRGLINFLIK